MAGRSIGVLTAFITADTAQFLREFNKLDRQVARASAKFTKPGAQMALGFLGVQNALTAVSGEIRHVIGNIEKIPGVPATAVASIISMRSNLADAKNWIDRMTAGIVAFGAQAAQAVGVGFAGLFGHNDTSGLSRQETPDEIASAQDPAFFDKMAAARAKLAEVQKAASIAAMTDAQQILALRKEAEAFTRFAGSKAINSVQKYEAQTSAAEKTQQANAKMAELRKRLEVAEEKSGKAFGDVLGASSTKPPDVRLDDLKRGEQDVRRKLAELGAGDQNDPENIQRQIKLREQLTTIYERQIPLLEKQKALAADVGNSIASSFENAVFEGGKLSDVVKGLGMDLARMMFRNMVTAPLAGLLSGGIFDFLGKFGGGRASGGPVSGDSAYLVGEQGPEIFVPGLSGSIIPNHALSTAGSRRAAPMYNFTYHIPAGVTKAELMPALMATKRATIAEIQNMRRRGAPGAV